MSQHGTSFGSGYENSHVQSQLCLQKGFRFSWLVYSLQSVRRHLNGRRSYIQQPLNSSERGREKFIFVISHTPSGGVPLPSFRNAFPYASQVDAKHTMPGITLRHDQNAFVNVTSPTKLRPMFRSCGLELGPFSPSYSPKFLKPPDTSHSRLL